MGGQTVRINFLVHENGFGDLTGMYVDDVQLLGPSATPTPTATATPTATVTPIATATATRYCYAHDAHPVLRQQRLLRLQPGQRPLPGPT